VYRPEQAQPHQFLRIPEHRCESDFTGSPRMPSATCTRSQQFDRPPRFPHRRKSHSTRPSLPARSLQGRKPDERTAIRPRLAGHLAPRVKSYRCGNKTTLEHPNDRRFRHVVFMVVFPRCLERGDTPRLRHNIHVRDDAALQAKPRAARHRVEPVGKRGLRGADRPLPHITIHPGLRTLPPVIAAEAKQNSPNSTPHRGKLKNGLFVAPLLANDGL